LYLRTAGSDDPDNHTVEVKHREYAFDLRGDSDIHLDGIDLFAATVVSDAGSDRLAIDHMDARYVSHTTVHDVGWDQPKDGIQLLGDSSVLQNSTIAYSSDNGVTLAGTNSRVSNCLIHDVDYGGADWAGVRIAGAYDQVDHTTIYNT